VTRPCPALAEAGRDREGNDHAATTPGSETTDGEIERGLREQRHDIAAIDPVIGKAGSAHVGGSLELVVRVRAFDPALVTEEG
jgi:hypothetical protein